MDGEVVKNDDVAFLQRGSKLGLDIGVEAGPVHGAVDDPGSGQPEASQAGNKRLGSPFAKRG